MPPQHGGVLLRRHLCKRLADYYSQPSNKVVGSIDYGFISRISTGIQSRDDARISSHQQSGSTVRRNNSQSINFSSLLGEWHWRRTYKKVYTEQQGMWLTPCELFTPYYSNILANFVSSSMKIAFDNWSKVQSSSETFEIVELGGGRGTNANALLNHLRENHQETYDRLDSYTIFDTSPTLHGLQREFLIGSSDDLNNNESKVHADKIKLVNVDLMNVAEGSSPFLNPTDKPTAVIALELLDNLPHDKIGMCMSSRDILQVEVHPLESSDPAARSHHSEIFTPLNDKLLQDILSIAPHLYAPTVSQGPRWVPTVALGVLMKIFECRPNATIAFADFDWLPAPDVTDSLKLAIAERALGDPLVTDMTGKDHSSYLSSPPDALCDILFPTDFGRLAAFVKEFCATKKKSRGKFPITVSSLKQNEFLLKHGAHEVEKTKSWLTGYSPLIHDFGNCSVLEVVPRSNSKKSTK